LLYVQLLSFGASLFCLFLQLGSLFNLAFAGIATTVATLFVLLDHLFAGLALLVLLLPNGPFTILLFLALPFLAFVLAVLSLPFQVLGYLGLFILSLLLLGLLGWSDRRLLEPINVGLRDHIIRLLLGLVASLAVSAATLLHLALVHRHPAV